MPYASREIHLVAPPRRACRSPATSAWSTARWPSRARARWLVRNLLMSVDPYMRPRLAEAQALDVAMDGGASAAGRLAQPGLRRGRHRPQRLRLPRLFLTSAGRWAAETGARSGPAARASTCTPWAGPASPPMAACSEIGKLKDGEQVFVSTAAGAVGSVVGPDRQDQGLLRRGLDRLGRQGPLADGRGGASTPRSTTRPAPIGKAVQAATPKGIDVYFDNVGGDHLDAALRRMNTLGRIAVCGMIAATTRPARAMVTACPPSSTAA